VNPLGSFVRTGVSVVSAYVNRRTIPSGFQYDFISYPVRHARDTLHIELKLKPSVIYLQRTGWHDLYNARIITIKDILCKVACLVLFKPLPVGVTQWSYAIFFSLSYKKVCKCFYIFLKKR